MEYRNVQRGIELDTLQFSIAYNRESIYLDKNAFITYDP